MAIIAAASLDQHEYSSNGEPPLLRLDGLAYPDRSPAPMATMIDRLFPLVFGLLALSMPALAQPAACPQFFPGGRPPALTNPRLAQRTTMLCNDAYAVLASGVTHGPIWSAERLTAGSLSAARETQREGQFHPEDRLPLADQAQLEDYRRSGFDRGHMTPSGDMPDAQSQQQSFSLANMVPQTSELNRGVWAGIEMAVRDFAVREGELYVVTGPAFQGQEIQSIGPDAVLVPSMTWKAVYSPRYSGTAAYACTNTARPQCEVISVAALTGVVGGRSLSGPARQHEAGSHGPARA